MQLRTFKFGLLHFRQLLGGSGVRSLWDRRLSLEGRISSCPMKGWAFFPGPEIITSAIDCGSANMQLPNIVSSKSCGLVKILRLWIRWYAVAEQHLFKSCWLKVADLKLRTAEKSCDCRYSMRICSCGRTFHKKLRILSCRSPSFALLSCDCGHKKNMRILWNTVPSAHARILSPEHVENNVLFLQNLNMPFGYKICTNENVFWKHLRLNLIPISLKIFPSLQGYFIPFSDTKTNVPKKCHKLWKNTYSKIFFNNDSFIKKLNICNWKFRKISRLQYGEYIELWIFPVVSTYL